MATTRQSRQPWLGVLVVALGLVVSAMALMTEADEGPRPPFLETSNPEPRPPEPEHRGVRLAGSGSNVPVTRALVATFAERTGTRPLVHAGISSAGGLRALLGGAVDVALVSRPLTDRERAQGLFETVYAKMPVLVAVNAAVPAEDISIDRLLRIYRGEVKHWADGTSIVVFQREAGDSSHAAVDRVLPQFATENDQAYRRGRWQVLYHEDAMREALENVEGAIGLHGSGLGPGVVGYRGLAIDGVAPSRATVESGRYPFVKTLSFVTVGPPRDQAAVFIDFVGSPAAASTIAQWGGVPTVDRGADPEAD